MRQIRLDSKRRHVFEIVILSKSHRESITESAGQLHKNYPFRRPTYVYELVIIGFPFPFYFRRAEGLPLFHAFQFFSSMMPREQHVASGGVPPYFSLSFFLAV